MSTVSDIRPASVSPHDATPTPKWRRVADALFPDGHDLVVEGVLLRGTGRLGEATFQVIGSIGHAAIGVEHALAMARDVLSVVKEHPGRPLMLLIDTEGQRLTRRDELLGINACIAHLAKCVELARRRGHRIVGLVYDQALSGGFLATGMMADVCAALPDAEIRVMNLPAMSRVTRIPEERLRELAARSPVFAPGAENYVAMGALDALWRGDLASALSDALRLSDTGDCRREHGYARGGRLLAAPVAERVATP